MRDDTSQCDQIFVEFEIWKYYFGIKNGNFRVFPKGWDPFPGVLHDFFQRGWVQDHFLHLFFFGGKFYIYRNLSKKKFGIYEYQIYKYPFLLI